jgi:DNA-directed RNA polymerase subunit K/omega
MSDFEEESDSSDGGSVNSNDDDMFEGGIGDFGFDDDDDEDEIKLKDDEDLEPLDDKKKQKSAANNNIDNDSLSDNSFSDEDSDNNDSDDEDEDEDLYLKKFDEEIKKNYMIDNHPECVSHNFNEINALTKIVRDENGNIIDDLHKTLPILTKYEKTKILGLRAKQINSGAKVFIPIPNNIFDGYLISQLELEQKRIPFIIRRPIPNGASEYWKIQDLEIL